MKSSRKLIFSFITTASFLLLLELALSIINYPTAGEGTYPLDINPYPYVTSDSILGYRHIPGNFTAQDQNSIVNISINVDGSRSCSKSTNQVTEKIDHYYGCSFTFGHGIDNIKTFCWLLQEARPSYQIKNYAVSGSGLLYAYLQITNRSVDSIPDRIIYNYASFQNIRSTNSLKWQKQLSTISTGLNNRFPRAVIKTDSLQIRYGPLLSEYINKGVFSKSRVVNFVEDIWASYRERTYYKSEKVNLMLFNAIQRYCSSHHIDFIVLGIDNDEATKNMLIKLNAHNIFTKDISFDFHQEKFLLRDNFHPNEKANQIFFENIINAIY